MKRQLVIALLFALCALAGFGQSASFSEPKAGAALVMSQTQMIAWTGSGNAAVKLVLVSKINGGSTWILKSGLAITQGSWPWIVGSLENGKTVPAGSDYLVRMQNMADGAIIAKTGLFSIAAAAAPATVAKGTMSRPAQPFSGLHPQFKEMALAAMPPPAGTTFTIKEIDYEFASEGKLAYVAVLITVNSPKVFAISPDYGDPQFGAQWLHCEIRNPSYEGLSCDGCSPLAFLGNFSVKGGGNSQRFSTYPAAALPAGPRDYVLVFTPLYPGLAKGIGIFQKVPNDIFQPGKLCKREFYPVLTITLTTHTAGGVLKEYNHSIDLQYDTNHWPLKWFKQPGEGDCTGIYVDYW